jgi:hypothetical protein
MQVGGLMHRARLSRIGFAVLVISVLALSCASSEPKSDFKLDVEDDEISVAISKEVARGLVEGLIGSDLECEGDVDGDFEALLEELDRRGPRSRASFRDGETTVDGRRRAGKLDLAIHGAGSGKIEASMPWAIAECLLGHTTSVDETLTSSIIVKITNDDGKNFSFKLQ